MGDNEDSGAEVPSDHQMTEWYLVIERVLTINNDHPWPADKAYAPEPLRADLQDCVDRDFLAVTRIDGSSPEKRFLLTVTPRGQVLFDMLHAQLLATGQAPARSDIAIASEPLNPFDGLERVPVAEKTQVAIREADELMKAANLPTYSDLLNGLDKLVRRVSPGMRPVTVDWIHKHITPLRPR